jgi:hypothetical protein
LISIAVPFEVSLPGPILLGCAPLHSPGALQDSWRWLVAYNQVDVGGQNF